MKYVATLNGKKYEIQVEKVPEYQPLSHEQTTAPESTTTSVPTPISTAAPTSAPAAAGKTKVVNPVPGSIYDIEVGKGQTVMAGQVLLVLEALKMENEIVAPVDGTITSVLVKKGDMVEKGDVLVIIN